MFHLLWRRSEQTFGQWNVLNEELVVEATTTFDATIQGVQNLGFPVFAFSIATYGYYLRLTTSEHSQHSICEISAHLPNIRHVHLSPPTAHAILLKFLRILRDR